MAEEEEADNTDKPIITSTLRRSKKYVFYDMKHSNNAARIRLWLRLTGVEVHVETKWVTHAMLEDPTYRSTINPWNKVPVLVLLDTGMVLYESVVILGYLQDKFGEHSSTQSSSPLSPSSMVLDTPEDRAVCQLLVRCHDLYVASPNCTQPQFSHTQGCMYLDSSPTPFTPARRTMDVATRAAKLKELHQQMVWLHDQMRLPFLVGDRITHADCTWFPTCVFLEFMLPRSFGWTDNIFHEPSVFPKLTQWYERCCAIPEFQRVREEILEKHRQDYAKGRLQSIRAEIEQHPEFQWKYM